MAKNMLQSSGDSWKELAESSSSYKPGANPTVQKMLTRMNEIWPFSQARGVLDNGCGSGTIMSRIVDHYGKDISPKTSLVAGDFSDHMLEAFRKTKEAQSQAPDDAWARIELRNVDAMDMSSIADDSMSHVTGGHLYFLVSDPQKALLETKRVLCPAGVIACTSGKSSEHADALKNAVKAISPEMDFNLLSGPWASEDGAQGELTAAGFVDVETHLVPSKISYESHQKFAKMLLQMPVMKNVEDRLSEDQTAQLEQQIVEEMRLINSDEPGALQGVGILALARKPHDGST